MAKGVKIPNEIVKEIINEYKKGHSPYWMIKNVSDLKDIRPSVIYGILKRENVETHRKIVLTDEQRKNRRKYDVNDDYFETIDSDDKAYWLGFMMADGWITELEDKVGLSLSIVDQEHLRKFKQSIGTDAPINVYHVNNGYSNNTVYGRIIVTSKKMKEDLIKHGVLVKKTTILKFPWYLREDLYMSFIRGYYDGDGCLTYGGYQKNGNKKFNIKIVGTYDIVQAINKVFNTNVKPIKRYPDRDIDNYTISIHGNIQVLRILNELYENATVFLDRKYDRYLELKKQSI